LSIVNILIQHEFTTNVTYITGQFMKKNFFSDIFGCVGILHKQKKERESMCVMRYCTCCLMMAAMYSCVLLCLTL